MYKRQDIQKSADNAAAPEQMNEANMAASNQGRTVPSPKIEPFSSAGDGMEAAGAEPAEASVEQDPPQSIQDRQSSKPDADETKDGNSASRTEANDTAKNDSINTCLLYTSSGRLLIEGIAMIAVMEYTTAKIKGMYKFRNPNTKIIGTLANAMPIIRRRPTQRSI